MSATYRDLTVELEGLDGLTFRAVTAGRLWNGWQMPLFDREEVTKLCNALTKEWQRNDPTARVAMNEASVIVVEDGENGVFEEVLPILCEDGVQRWLFDGWTFTEVEEKGEEKDEDWTVTRDARMLGICTSREEAEALALSEAKRFFAIEIEIRTPTGERAVVDHSGLVSCSDAYPSGGLRQ